MAFLVDQSERAELWRRLDACLPQGVFVLRRALKRRVFFEPDDPLRNHLICKMLVGIHNPSRLIGQFQNAATLLTNWPDFVADIAQRSGPDFDMRLRPWIAELRALDYLRAERGALRATAVARMRKQKTPDFIVRRKDGDGLAEVKLVTPNNNYETIEAELEIAAIRWPEVFRPHLYIVETPDDRDIILSDERDALAGCGKTRDRIDRGAPLC